LSNLTIAINSELSPKEYIISGQSTHKSGTVNLKILQEGYDMVKKKPPVSHIAFFMFSSIFLLLVQFGFIQPEGLVVITNTQYIVLFWLSIAFFVASVAILLTHYPHYARWTMGYSGVIVRTVRLSGMRRDFFIRGAPDAKVRVVLLDTWPFETEKPNSDWQVIDSLGNDVSDQLLESITETIEVVFPPYDSV
jgi:hypothetical protein